MSTPKKPKRGRPKLTHKRVLLQATILPATLRAIDKLRRELDLSRGRVIDQAIAAMVERPSA